MGFEPTNGGTTIHCLNRLATLAVRFITIAHYLKLIYPWGKIFWFCLKVAADAKFAV